MPSKKQLADYQVKMKIEDFRGNEKKQSEFFGMGGSGESSGETDENFTFEKFLNIPCWMDEWDESLCNFFFFEMITIRHEFERGRCL